MANYTDRFVGVNWKEASPYISDSVMTKAQMLADTYVFDGKPCICSEDFALYVYDNSATASAETGKYKKASSDAVVFTEVTTLPTTDINEQTIYLHKTTNLLGKHKFRDSVSGDYTVSSAGITEVASGDTEDWDTVTANWADKYAELTENSDTGDIAEYDDAGATKYIDTASFVEEMTFIPKYYRGKWRTFGGGGGLSNVTINNADLSETNTSDSLNITWQGSQDDYDALTDTNPQTLYCIDDEDALPSGSSYNSLENKPTLESKTIQGDMTLTDFGIASKAEVNAKQNSTDNSLNTSSKNIPLAINELLNRINALVGGIKIKVVATQPATGENNTIYFINPTSPYTMKLYTDADGWTELGSTSVSLDDYQKKAWTNTVFTAQTIEGVLSEIASGYVKTDKILTAKSDSATDSQLYSAKYANSKLVSLDNLYKVGDVYETLSTTETTSTLATRFGGTWEALKDREEYDDNSFSIAFSISVEAKFAKSKYLGNNLWAYSAWYQCKQSVGSGIIQIGSTRFKGSAHTTTEQYMAGANGWTPECYAINNGSFYKCGSGTFVNGTNIHINSVVYVNGTTPDRTFKRFKRTA